MLKKVLIGVGVLVVILAVVFGVVTYKVVKTTTDTLKEKEPEFRQYVTMTVDEQNAYVEKNMGDFMNMLATKLGDEEAAEKFKQRQNDPEIVAAEIQWGRSVIAGLILSMDDIVKDLTPEQKAALKAEADETEARADKYGKAVEKVKSAQK